MEPFQNEFVATIIVQDNVSSDTLSKLTEVVKTIMDTYTQVKKDYLQLLEGGSRPGEEIPGILRIRRSDGDVYDTIFSGGDIDAVPHIEIIKQTDIDTNPFIDESWIIFVYVDELRINSIYSNINTRARDWSRIIIFTANDVTPQLRNNDFCIRTLNKRIEELTFIIGEIICAFMCHQLVSLGIDEFCTENHQPYDFIIFNKDSVYEEMRINNFVSVVKNIRNASNVFLILRFQPDKVDINILDYYSCELSKVIINDAKFCITDNSTLNTDHKHVATLVYC
jgi:hypothetical protein